MTPQERQMIDSLFQRLGQSATQAGPRDPEAEALIQQHVQQMPGATYHMAQAMVVQERALQQAQARLAAYEQPGSFAGPTAPPAQGQYPPQAPAKGGGAGGFLGGAAKIALGVGGGILAAEAATALVHEVFGAHQSGQFGPNAYEQGYQQGFDQGHGSGDQPYSSPGSGAFGDSGAGWGNPGADPGPSGFDDDGDDFGGDSGDGW